MTKAPGVYRTPEAFKLKHLPVDTERKVSTMDSRLDRYLDQQDSEYSTYLETDTGYPVTPQDEKTYLQREISCIERHLSLDECDSLVTPDQWLDRLTECRARLRGLLEQEAAALKGTATLHCEGLIKVHLRQLEIESELSELGVGQ